MQTVLGDIRYQWMSRYFFYSVGCFALTAAIFAVGAYGTARCAVSALQREWQFLHTEGGYTFERATGQGADPSDAPLKETWDQAGHALANLHPIQGAVNLLEVLCFVVAPLLFFAYGAIAATRDAHHQTLKFRAVREGFPRLFAAQAGALFPVVILLSIAVLVVALLTSSTLSLTVVGNIDATLTQSPRDIPFLDVLPILGTFMLTGISFSILGMGAAHIFQRPLYVIPAFCVSFLLVPVLGRFDPRNLLMAISYPHLRFVGGLEPVPPVFIPELVALWVLICGGVAVLASAYTISSRRSRYTV
ncbi:hypothetical protein OG302_00875 [Streptomyces sp. NBC_01283]|uniref:hypothetical protein n=1 Tax=Streptomyces sp. NBC_01283 TaxID=2903812 RepID=UPI00352DB5FA|nr:hypothetical protein OG302_00875 [Streptomyces sp. NBC_01283]